MGILGVGIFSPRYPLPLQYYILFASFCGVTSQHILSYLIAPSLSGLSEPVIVGVVLRR
jgi:hypothetical protein